VSRPRTGALGGWLIDDLEMAPSKGRPARNRNAVKEKPVPYIPPGEDWAEIEVWGTPPDALQIPVWMYELFARSWQTGIWILPFIDIDDTPDAESYGCHVKCETYSGGEGLDSECPPFVEADGVANSEYQACWNAEELCREIAYAAGCGGVVIPCEWASYIA
jgi:hypothetical protein